MAAINRISAGAESVFNTCLKQPMLNLQKSEFMQKGYEAYRNDKQSFMNWAGILSIVAKDGLGCVMYVWQSLNNKNIPDDKRKFVAALDLTNGGLMIAAQIIMHMTISQKIVQTKMFNKLFGKAFDRNTAKMIHSVTKNIDKLKHISQQEINEKIAKRKDTAFAAFTTLTSLIAATTVGKRIIVPFIATPAASKVEKWMNKGEDTQTVNAETKNDYNEQKNIEPKKAESTKSVNA